MEIQNNIQDPGQITNDTEQTSVEGIKSNSQGAKNFVAKNFLALSILISGILISGSVLYSSGNGSNNIGTAQIGNNQPSGAKVEVSIGDSSFLGKDDAPVTIIEFSDYQCPFCRSFWRDTLPQIKKEYIDTGKVKFVYRNLPLSFHPAAAPSALAAECAGDHGRYWDMHDKIFTEQEKQGQGTVMYTVDDIKRWAVEIGIDSARFNECFNSEKYKNRIEKDIAEGTAAGATGTPSFFINGRFIVGAQPYSVFKSLIEEELKNK